jgi:hypothetical protein
MTAEMPDKVAGHLDWRPRHILVGYDRTPGPDDAVALCRPLSPEDAEVALVDVLPSPGAPSETFRLFRSSPISAARPPASSKASPWTKGST